MPGKNSKFKIQSSKFSKNGFTLVELLISIVLISLVTVVAIPNFRQLSKDQEINNTASQLVNTLRRAQSSAASRTQCPSGVVADNWSVELTTVDYKLKSQCSGGGSNLTVYTNPYAETPTGSKTFSRTASVCGAGETLIIYFTNSQITYKCPTGSILPIPAAGITITLDPSGLNKSVVIEQGGTIR